MKTKSIPELISEAAEELHFAQEYSEYVRQLTVLAEEAVRQTVIEAAAHFNRKITSDLTEEIVAQVMGTKY